MMNEPIENTPFRIIGNDEQGYAIAVSKYRITEILPTKKAALQQLRKDTTAKKVWRWWKKNEQFEIPWNTIANLISVMLQVHDDLQDQATKTPAKIR